MHKVNKLTVSDPSYPHLLRQIQNPPKNIFVVGSINALQSKESLAVIGTRKPTAYGKSVTQQLVTEVASKQIPIISGLALGVDGIAHRTALEAGGSTIAVLPCGPDKIYPQTNHGLAQMIVKNNGALISEYPPGTPPLRQHFIARNRIVSGLATAVLITEAAEKSGTLHTANFALEQGRAVLAAPGNITSQFSKGTNRLIATGAKPVTSAEDILEEFSISQNDKSKAPFAETAEEATILSLLEVAGILEGRALLEQSELSAETFSQTMTMLEISGKIRALGADNWSLR